MSVNFTESFFAFGTYNGSDAFDTEGNEARTVYGRYLERAAYEVETSDNTSADTSGGFVVRDNPLRPAVGSTPQQHMLVHSSGAVGAVNVGVTAALRRNMPMNAKDIIIGFNLYVPPEYVPNSAASTVPCFRMAATLESDLNWKVAGLDLAAPKELFRVTNDLALRWGTDATQSGKKIRVGAANYIEVRIQPATVSVWIDDTFVMQKNISIIPDTLAWIFENNINTGVAGTSMSGVPGRWGIFDMYLMFNDGVAPTARLGPTTQVIGNDPTDDVSVQFVRPGGWASNAEVVAQDITDDPAAQLSSVTIGDSDTYSTDQGDAIRSIAQVHAVAVKVLATNLEPDMHTLRPFVAVGASQGADAKAAEIVLLPSVLGGRTIRAMAIRPTDNRIFVCGDGSSIYASGPNFDYSLWTKVADVGDANSFVGITFKPSGAGVAVMYMADHSVARMYPIAAGAVTINVPGVVNTDYRAAPSGFLDPTALILAPDNTTWVACSSVAAGGSSRFITSTDAVTWTLRQPTHASIAGGETTMFKSASRIFSPMITVPGNYLRSDDNGLTWAMSNLGDTTAPFTAGTYDGTQVMAGLYSNDGPLSNGPRVRRSVDNGVQWSAVTAAGTTLAGGNATLRGAVSAAGETLFFGDSGAMIASSDSINWRQMPRITANALNAAVAMPNGDILIGGALATLVLYRKQSIDNPMPPLTGYHMTFNAVALNPATGSPWTANEAADSLFGMKLTS